MANLLETHLHPLTLAFDQALREGSISVEVADIFCDRIHEAVLEAKVRANPRLRKDAVFGGAIRTVEGSDESE